VTHADAVHLLPSRQALQSQRALVLQEQALKQRQMLLLQEWLQQVLLELELVQLLQRHH
jgi:hypothetical protein